MKFCKALKKAQEVAIDSEYCTTMYRKKQDHDIGFLVGGKIKAINLTNGKPIYKRSFSIDDLLADDWVVINAYGEEV